MAKGLVLCCLFPKKRSKRRRSRDLKVKTLWGIKKTVMKDEVIPIPWIYERNPFFLYSFWDQVCTKNKSNNIARHPRFTWWSKSRACECILKDSFVVQKLHQPLATWLLIIFKVDIPNRKLCAFHFYLNSKQLAGMRMVERMVEGFMPFSKALSES